MARRPNSEGCPTAADFITPATANMVLTTIMRFNIMYYKIRCRKMHLQCHVQDLAAVNFSLRSLVRFNIMYKIRYRKKLP